MEELRLKLADAGFADLDSPMLVLFMCWFATALRDGPMSSSFHEVNDRVGTANLIASGRVRIAMDELSKRVYLRVSSDDGVVLTPRGLNAAAVADITFD